MVIHQDGAGLRLPANRARPGSIKSIITPLKEPVLVVREDAATDAVEARA
jgi:hypothetical protein